MRFNKIKDLADAFKERLPSLQKKLKTHQAFIGVLVVSFLLADLLILRSQLFFIPKRELPARRIKAKTGIQKTLPGQYTAIWEDNIFHRGPIPTQLLEETISTDPLKTNLPFVLKGTIVHVNPHRSIATVKSKTKESRSYQVGDIIEKQAEIMEIERRKIIFLNQNNNLLEFLKIPENKTSPLAYTSPKKITLNKPSPVKQAGQAFKMKRSQVNKYMKKLPEILQQARMVPNKVTRNGEVFMEGFRFASIKKDSIYEDLGFKIGDVITEVEGVEVNSPEKALELYSKFQTNSRIQMVVNGQQRTYTVEDDAPPEF